VVETAHDYGPVEENISQFGHSGHNASMTLILGFERIMAGNRCHKSHTVISDKGTSVIGRTLTIRISSSNASRLKLPQ
jgi:hypothetical protein